MQGYILHAHADLCKQHSERSFLSYAYTCCLLCHSTSLCSSFKHAGGHDTDVAAFVQVYINGEFVGGADVLEEMYGNGELKRAISA